MKLHFQFYKTLLLFLVLIICNSVFAQEYDLKSFIGKVKENNIELKQSTNQTLLAEQDVKISRSALLPNISLEGYYQRDFNKNFLFINDLEEGQIKFRTNFNNSVNVDAVFSQTLFDPAIFSSFKIAKLAEELSKLNNENDNNELITQASTLYWQAIFAKESIQVLQENLNLAKDQLDHVQKLYTKGVVSELEVKQVETLYKKTVPSLNNAQNQYDNLLNELKNIANIPASEELILTDNLETIQLHPITKEPQADLAHQTQVKVIKKQIEIAEKQINANRKFWYPKLTLTSFYSYNAQDDNLTFSNNENKVFSGRLGLSIPILSGGRNRAEIAKSRIEKEMADFELIKIKQYLSTELNTAMNTYNNAVENIAIHKETISLNEQEIEIFNKQLQLGVVTAIEFKESRVRLAQSRLELLNEYLELQIVQLQIARILGTNF